MGGSRRSQETKTVGKARMGGSRQGQEAKTVGKARLDSSRRGQEAQSQDGWQQMTPGSQNTLQSQNGWQQTQPGIQNWLGSQVGLQQAAPGNQNCWQRGDGRQATSVFLTAKQEAEQEFQNSLESQMDWQGTGSSGSGLQPYSSDGPVYDDGYGDVADVESVLDSEEEP